MSDDLFESLAELAVPPVPDNFDREVHQRVNRLLVLEYLVELATKGLWFATVHFARAAWSLVVFTVSGKLGDPRTRRNR